MRKRRILAALTALLLLAGCQAAPVPSGMSSEPLVSGQMVIVDNASPGGMGQVPEKPSILAGDPAMNGASDPESLSPDTLVSSPPLQQSDEGLVSEPIAYEPELPEQEHPFQQKSQPVYSAASSSEVRAVWISYLELGPILLNRTESQFTKSIRDMFDNCVEFGLNTAIVHVRPFGDALYDSGYFPWSYLLTGQEGGNPGYDPLEIMVREAHARGLKIEAWLNPYRVRHDPKYGLSADNQAKIWLDEGSSHVASNGIGNIVFNPASTKAQDLIVSGVREIVRGYDVDGIHIDDYFYPATMTPWDTSFDEGSYRAYQTAGGELAHDDWRRRNVDVLLRKIYAAVKEEDPEVLFGISPQSSVYNNYNAMYFDVGKALSTPGYCDYICPQIYFGFQNGTQPYSQTLAQWGNMIVTPGVKLYTGLAVYKAGLPDSWAGAGSAEWQNNDDIIASQVLEARRADCYGGFVLYRYDSLFRPAEDVRAHIAGEAARLEELL